MFHSLIFSSKLTWQFLRWGIVLLVLFSGLVNTLGYWNLAKSDAHKEIYRRDILQDQLMARALLRGENPYRPIPEMAKDYLNLEVYVNLHPSPHTLLTPLLLLPLDTLPIQTTQDIWNAVGLLFLLLSILVSVNLYYPEKKLFFTLLLFSIFLNFKAVGLEVYFGQINFILLFISTLIFAACLQNKTKTIGVLVGLSFAFRFVFIGYLLLIVFKRWKGTGFYFTITGMAFLILTVAIIGWSGLINYIGTVLPQVSNHWQTYFHNFSLSSFLHNVIEPAYIYRSQVIRPTNSNTISTVALSFLALTIFISMFLSYRKSDTISLIFKAIIANLIFSPLIWQQNFVVFLLPISILILDFFKRLEKSKFLLLTFSNTKYHLFYLTLLLPALIFNYFEGYLYEYMREALQLFSRSSSAENFQASLTLILANFLPTISTIILLVLPFPKTSIAQKKE